MDNFCDNIKRYYKEHYIFITLLVSTFFLGLSCYWFPFIFVAILVFCPYVFFSKIEEDFYVLIYSLLFATCTAFFFPMVAIVGISVLIKLIIDAVKGNIKFYKRTFFITLGICIFFSLINYGYTFKGFFQGSIYFLMPFIIFIIFTYRKKINVQECFKFLFIGIISSLVLSMIINFIPGGLIFNYFQGNYGFKKVSDVIFLQDGPYHRLILLSFSHNQLGDYCIYYLTFAVYMLVNTRYEDNKLQYLFIIISFVIALVIGMYTLSKSFFILAILVFIYGFFIAIYNIKNKNHLIMFCAFATAFVIFLILGFFRLNIFDRFLNPNDASNKLFSNLVTGRNEIWRKYLDDIISTPLKIVFGSGIFAKDVVDIGPHNMYLGIFYRFGLLGIFAFGALAISYAFDSGIPFKTSFKQIIKKALPFVIFAIQSLSEANVDERFLFLLFAIMLLFGNYPVFKDGKNIYDIDIFKHTKKDNKKLEINGEIEKETIEISENLEQAKDTNSLEEN